MSLAPDLAFILLFFYIMLVGYVIVRSILSRIERHAKEMQNDMDIVLNEIDDLKKFLMRGDNK
jgi:hypothetical protein